ncbi:DUF5776 domain-containing protein [Lentilactobacillus raoultii]|uniref:DUF5776 domain-containing protein n=1 Tax=Lentilactobacillus raoultii TaxID=1987503 RepID=A0ABW3PLK4_9LACO|nr:DUF5776 domain-containing protein [Lentilactobacillus raoultii]
MENRHYFHVVAKAKKRVVWLSVVGLMAGLAIGTSVAAESSPSDQGDAQASRSLVPTPPSVKSPTAGQTTQPAVKADGMLEIKWGTCPLSLKDGILTIHAGEMAPRTWDDPGNPLNSLLWSGWVTGIHVEKGVILPADASYLFGGLPVSSIIFNEGIDTSRVTNMTEMFAYDPKLVSLDLGHFNTRQVTTMYLMFFGDSSLTSLNVSSFETQNVKKTALMFAGDTKLESLDLSHFDTRQAAAEDRGTYGMLGFTTQTLESLWKVKVGPNTVISNKRPIGVLGIPGLVNAPGSSTPGREHPFTDAAFPGATFKNNGPKWQEAGTSQDGHNPTGPLLSAKKLNAYLAKPRDKSETWVWQQLPAQTQSLLIHYVDADGKTLAPDYEGYGYQGGTYDVSAAHYRPEINGYTWNGKLPDNYQGTYADHPVVVKYVYDKKPVTPEKPGGGSSGSSQTGTSTTGSSIIKPGTPATPGNNGGNNGSNGNGSHSPTDTTSRVKIVRKVVYAVRAIHLYRSANFERSQRLASYSRVKRTERPMFIVLGYRRSTGGALRFQVRDINHGKHTAGKVGYITASHRYVVNAYYQSLPKTRRLTVISPKGVHAYRSRNLTGRSRSYKRGTRLKVKRLLKHNLTTRYQLTNGYYVTANKKLVIQKN